MSEHAEAICEYFSRIIAQTHCGVFGSVRALLELSGVIKEADFDAWQCRHFWSEVLGSKPNGVVWFDIVLADPISGQFDYTAVYCGKSESFYRFEAAQQKASTPFYRDEVLSLSGLFVDGLAAPQCRFPILLRRRKAEISVVEVSNHRFREFTVSHPDWELPLIEDSRWLALGEEFEESREFVNVCRGLEKGTQVRENSVANGICPVKLARYFAWLAWLPDWVTYLYIPIPSFSRKSGAVVYAFDSDVGQEDLVKLYDLRQRGLLALAMTVSQMAENTVSGFAWRSASAAVISRNMSHNIGSHVVAGLTWPKLKEYARDTEHDDEKSKGRPVELLLGYLQQRMDFVARVTTEWPGWREPVLFVQDLLRGFLKQKILLDKLASDKGIRHKDITFSVRTPRMSTFVDVAELHGGTNVPGSRQETSVEDILVAIPGGVVGRQAFYGFLENAIRNTARHGTVQPAGLHVYLSVDDASGDQRTLRCTYADNFTRQRIGDQYSWDVMNAKIDLHLIEPGTARMRKQDWGIQEMKVSASFLAYDGFRMIPGERALRADAFPLPGVDDVLLGYQFKLFRANLVAVSGEDPVPACPTAGMRELGIWHLRAAPASDELLEAIRELSPGLLYLAVPAQDQVEALVSWLKKHRHSLPSRILLGLRRTLTGPRGRRDDLLRLLQQEELTGRCVVVAGPRDGMGFPWPSDRLEAERFVIRLYWRWLRAFGLCSGEKPPFRVCVGLARSSARELTKWIPLGEYFAGHFGSISRKIPVYLMYAPETALAPQTVVAPWKPTEVIRANLDNLANQNGTFLLFDNHYVLKDSVLRSVFSRKGTFHHVISHRQGEANATSDSAVSDPYDYNPSAFERCLNPPGGFPGVLSLLQSIEAALLRVLIIDERVAEVFWAVEGNRIEKKSRPALVDSKNARLTVVPWVLVDETPYCILPTTKAVFDPGDPHMSISTKGKLTVTIHGLDAIVRQDASKWPVDVVIVHWAQVEQFGQHVPVLLEALERLAYRVVITSGRGVPREGELARYPFLEYSVLEACAVKELDKVQLGSVLLALQGTPGDDEDNSHGR